MQLSPAFAILALGALLSSAPASAEESFDRIVAFGDSLSDPGNAFVLTGQFVVRPFEPIPSASYLLGRFHFTNGLTWVEYLARKLGVRASARPAFARPGVFTNYAVGGARARPADLLDLGEQVAFFLADFEDEAPPDALYALWIGSNDVRDALAALESDPATSEAIIAAALAATRDAIIALADAGASSFLVLNIPNLADTPAVRALDPPAQAAARALTEGYNAGLAAVLLDLEAMFPDSVIRTFDVFTALGDIVADPKAVGLRNATDSCITPGVIIGAICRRSFVYLFWDFIHPTTRAHKLLSREAQAVLEMAPEAALAGFSD